jgi:2-polyprenyl-3-methyl-5-hydroxy-6-metoxy-1,4-benzoquinol methylase
MRLVTRSMTSGSYYAGIRMMTSEGVHEEVGRLAAGRLPAERRAAVEVLDMGAGEGALSQRLRDLGFARLTAWELDPARFRVEAIRVEAVDLEAPFPESARGRFDLATAVEVVEHLENPYAFFRQTAGVLTERGVAIVTTPNVESARSRLRFLRTGEFRWFGESEYHDWGHIQPLSAWELDKALRQSGLKVLERSYNLRDALLVYDPGLRRMLGSLVAAAMTPFLRGNARGDINVWVIGRA